MKTTFINFLKKQEENEIIYLGTKHGSNWIVIDTAKNIIDKIDKLENYLHKQAVKNLSTSKNRMKELPYNITETLDRLKEETEKEKSDVDEVKKLKRRLDSYEKRYVSAYNTKVKYERALSSWKTVGNRLVVESYKHETDIVGTCVLIKGFEDGSLWCKGEHKDII